KQNVARTGVDEHAKPAPLLHDLLVGELLIGLEHGQRVDAKLGGYIAHRWQRIAFVQHAIEDVGDDAIAQLPIDRLIVIPGIVHRGFKLGACFYWAFGGSWGSAAGPLARAWRSGVAAALSCPATTITARVTSLPTCAASAQAAGPSESPAKTAPNTIFASI